MSNKSIFYYLVYMIIKFPKYSLKINLNSPETAKKLNLLKEIKSKINTLGDEVYTENPYLLIKLDQKAWDLIGFEEIIYWYKGNSIAKGFGLTPVSKNSSEIRLLLKKTNVFESFRTSITLLNSLNALN